MLGIKIIGLEIFIIVIRLHSIKSVFSAKYPPKCSKFHCKYTIYSELFSLFIFIDCGTVSPNMEGRIVGGLPIPITSFPWQVGIISFESRPFCGGCLLTSRYVLTAAHCVYTRKPQFTNVLIGENYANTRYDRLHQVIEIISHPRYNYEYFINDLALLKLRDTVVFNNYMKPPCFPRPGLNYDGEMARVGGWGRLVEKGLPSSYLMAVDVPIVSLKKCKKAYGFGLIQSSMICAGFDSGGKDACEGDSGGPLVWRNKSRWYLIGLVSWGIGCARPYSPAPYTRVDKYYKWLDLWTRASEFCNH